MTTPHIARRHLLGLGGLAALGGAGLTGCAHGSAGSTTAFKQPKYKVPKKYQGRKHEVVVWHAFGAHNGKAIDKLAQDFNDSQSDIYAAFQYQGSYSDLGNKVTSTLRTDTAPDMVVQAVAHFGRLILNELAAPLDDLIDCEKTFVKPLVDEWTVKGRHYQAPFARSTPLMYFNRAVLKKAGLPDRGPKTWDELREWAGPLQKVKNPKGKPMLPFMASDGGFYFQAKAWEFGGKLSDGLDVECASGGALDAATWFQQLNMDGYAAKTTKEAFTTGFVAMALFSTAAVSGLEKAAKFRLGTAFLPKQKAVGVPTGGSGWSLFRRTPDERQQAVAEVLKFLSTPESSAYWSTATGYLPVANGAVDTRIYRKRVSEDPYFNTAYKQLPLAQPQDAIRTLTSTSENFIVNALDEIYVTHKDPKKVMKTLEDKLQASADKVKPQYEKVYGA